MTEIETFRTLKKYRSPRDNRPVPGCWEGEGVRLEKDPDKGWAIQVRLKEIGTTRYHEYSSHGLWMHVGHYKTREVACRAADLLKAGTHVFRPAHSFNGTPMPDMLYRWENVKVEIGTHPSVTGEEPRRLESPNLWVYYRTGGTLNFEWRRLFDRLDEAGAALKAEQIQNMGYKTVIVREGTPAPTTYEPAGAVAS